MLTYLLICALSLTLVGAGPTYGQKQPNVEPVPLQPRAIFAKPTQTVINDLAEAQVVVLKFHEGTHVRLRDGQLKAELAARAAQEKELLKRNQITEDQIKQELFSVGKLLSQYGAEFKPAFERKEQALEQEKLEGELNTGEEWPI